MRQTFEFEYLLIYKVIYLSSHYYEPRCSESQGPGTGRGRAEVECGGAWCGPQLLACTGQSRQAIAVKHLNQVVLVLGKNKMSNLPNSLFPIEDIVIVIYCQC